MAKHTEMRFSLCTFGGDENVSGFRFPGTERNPSADLNSRVVYLSLSKQQHAGGTRYQAPGIFILNETKFTLKKNS